MLSFLIATGFISAGLVTFLKLKKKRNIINIRSFFDTYAEIDVALPGVKCEAGQFMAMNFFINGKKVSRAYSLSNDQVGDGYGRFIVKRVVGGTVSNFLLDNAKNIKHIDISGPYGDFILNKDSTRHIFIAGGSGITPIASILNTYLKKRKNDSFFLIYGNRNSQETILDDELFSLSKVYDNLKILSFSSDGSFKSLPSVQGVLNQEIISNCIENFHHDKDTSFYVCGPQIVIDNCKKVFESLDIDESNIKIEKFVSLKNIEKENKNTKIVNLTIFQENKELSIDCLKNSVVLNSCLKNNIEISYSCLSGICKMCKVSAEGNFKEKFPLLETDENGKKQILSCSTYIIEDSKIIIKKQKP